MDIDHLSVPSYSESDILELIYQDRSDLLDKILVDVESGKIAQFNELAKTQGGPELTQYQPIDLDIGEFDSLLQHQWLMPDEYKTLDIETFLVQHSLKENNQRLMDELEEFRERGLLDLLRWMKYFVDTCRANNIVWGVGRGSSVASYVLYVIGVHKIDSVKYDLDWREFLR